MQYPLDKYNVRFHIPAIIDKTLSKIPHLLHPRFRNVTLLGKPESVYNTIFFMLTIVRWKDVQQKIPGYRVGLLNAAIKNN